MPKRYNHLSIEKKWQKVWEKKKVYRASNTVPKKKKMYVSIKDTGVGMSRQTQEDVFDKFVRAKNANDVNVTGTGLGLYVARKIVEEMGGKIHARSEGEEKGSEFIIELFSVNRYHIF